ncbi:MAG: CRISPR-associated endonuclease Cas2 [Candidatus Methanosuratincola sp.]|jgi:CRISPR-associated protein Cas2|nr:CRISPR-associated endonuclease Cas2 [Candidatus Methanosuratincola sp.]
MQTLVIYDISDDKKRQKLREHLLNYGLRGIQYSGLLGSVETNDRLILVNEVGKFISSETDSIYVVPLCDRCARLCKIVSRSGALEIYDRKVEYVG